MISRIRVEARAASMEEARREIEIVLGHAQQAAFMEGLTPQVSRVTDDHFGAIYGHDQWHDFEMGYEGRMMLKFEPEPNPGGGLKQHGFKVTRDVEDDQSAGRPFDAADDGADCTATSIVLTRQQEVTREYSWDRVPQRQVRSLEWSDNGEAILADIKTIRNVTDVEAVVEVGDRRAAKVSVRMDGWEDVTAEADTLALAAYEARRKVLSMLNGEGQTSDVDTGDPFEAMSLYEGVDFDIKPLEHNDINRRERWRVNVSYGNGHCGFHSVGATIEDAGRDALSQLRAIYQPPTATSGPAGVANS